MTSQFVTTDQKRHIEAAKRLTGSTGFLEDAKAIAVYKKGEPIEPKNLAAIAIFEAFRGGRAELHFGAEEGHPLALDWITCVVTVAFHPKFFNLDTLVARVPYWNINAQCLLLKLGFEFEYRDRGSTAGGDDGIVFSLSRAKALEQAAAGPMQHPQPDAVSGE